MSEPITAPTPAVENKAEDVKPLEPSTLATEETKPEETTQAALVTEDNTAETAAPVAATEETPAETSAEAAVEPVTSGVLGYKAPGLIKHFKFSKRYFWLGDEAISTQHLSHYLRGTEARIAHPVAAWSSQTGKGLLYLVKSESEKSHPQDVIALADTTDLQKASPHEFSFKVHGDKHTFKAANDAERNGWFLAIEQAVEEAKASKDEIRKSEGYQESVKHLGKPAALAGGVAPGGAAASAAAVSGATAAAVAKKEEETTSAEPVEGAARVNSHSSSSSDEAAKKEKKEAKKSRSVSRGKRNSIFASFLGKKEDKEVKKEEEKTEEKHAAEGAATGAVVAGGAATGKPSG
ncbi:hypothetical protein K461DRAFT_275125 [Myriangium duriaei CBS 260.36]|uniref:PH domain-containing protein n=1 Tax=Myriangium duriaei CBS 260.36 TaxID=1168546 RepID=A0A9P4JBP3_9PEZI|nr:hypothetical protein K461DRAFT_275125 [Myriangium duriaei CBS 260.36]